MDIDYNKLAEFNKELDEAEPFKESAISKKTVVFLRLYPTIYKMRELGHKWGEITEELKLEFNVDFTKFYLCGMANKISHEVIYKKYRGLYVLSPTKKIPETILNKAVDSEYGFKVISRISEENKAYAILPEELKKITDPEGRMLAKRIMSWFEISDTELVKEYLKDKVTTAFKFILDHIEEKFQKEYLKLIPKIKNPTKERARND